MKKNNLLIISSADSIKDIKKIIESLKDERFSNKLTFSKIKTEYINQTLENLDIHTKPILVNKKQRITFIETFLYNLGFKNYLTKKNFVLIVKIVCIGLYMFFLPLKETYSHFYTLYNKKKINIYKCVLFSQNNMIYHVQIFQSRYLLNIFNKEKIPEEDIIQKQKILSKIKEIDNITKILNILNIGVKKHIGAANNYIYLFVLNKIIID